MPASSQLQVADNAGCIFQFISMQSPGQANDSPQRRQVRSHAIKQGLELKRRTEQKTNSNFHNFTLKNKGERRRNGEMRSVRMWRPPSAGAIDPFDSLAVDSAKLQKLLGDYRIRQAPEPVFSVEKSLSFQSIQHVFGSGLVDPALVNAVMFSLLFAESGGKIDRKCLQYQSRAITHVREKMARTAEATTEATIGSILLLAGVEARLGMTSQVELHMGAVQQLLQICSTSGIYLTAGIKRAVFWQDLNSAVLAGSTRKFHHTTFSELLWARDPFSPKFYKLPLGFQKIANILSNKFAEVIEDIHALQCIRNTPGLGRKDPLAMAYINNHTASIQCRLEALRTEDPLIECCRLAAYMSSVMLCCTLWCALFVPLHISKQLLRQLEALESTEMWTDSNLDLLEWLLYIGGSFTSADEVRQGYILLLRKLYKQREIIDGRKPSWQDTSVVLEQFIWSDSAFSRDAGRLWDEVG